MNKLFGRLLPVWTAISAVIVLAGIVLMALLGFNYIAPEKKTVEISYDELLVIEDKVDALEELCEKQISANGLTFTDKATASELDVGNIAEDYTKILSYTFDKDVADSALRSLVEGIRRDVAANASMSNVEIVVTAHTMAAEKFYESAWRGGVALGVAAILALVYVGFRFGVACAVTGLVAVVHDSLFTLSVLAITRLPVYAFSPVLFAGIAAALSLILWLAQCMKMRENFKDPSYAALSAQEAVGESCRTSVKFMLLFIIPIAIVLIVLGAMATFGVAKFMLPALIPLAVSVYSSFLLAPAVLVPLKSKIDRFKTRQKRYVGKKKAQE